MTRRMMMWAEKLLLVSLSAVLLSCSGCGSGENSNAGNADDGATLPWPSPFIEPGYTQQQVIEQAAALRDENTDRIPASLRDELTGHVEMLFSASPTALTIQPATESEAWAMAGVSAIFQGSLEVATWCFSNAVLADPADERSLNQLGWALLADERIEEAKGVLLHAAELEPRLWSIWSNLGHAADVSDESDRAVYYFGRGLEYHPESLNMHLRRGGLMLERGEIVVAAAHATQALAISPTDPEVTDFADEVEAAGGDIATAQPLAQLPGGDGMSDVIRDFDDCVEDATQRYSQSMIPFVTDVVAADQLHIFHMGDIQASLVDCEADCSGAMDSCFNACMVLFCGSATAAEVGNYMDHLRVASVDMSYNAAFRTRMRGCAYNAVETHEDSVSEESIQDFIVYVNSWCAIEAEASRLSFLEEQGDLALRLPVATDCPEPTSISAESLSLTFDLEGLGISVGLETCLDGFACISFGETSFGFSAGINVVSAGVDINYGTPDVIFSVGTGYDAGLAAAGVSLKLSIQNGIGVSPGVKVGGIIRTTYSRDFWLLSF